MKQNIPYNLNFKSVPSSILKKRLLEDFKLIFEKYKHSSDKMNLTEKWSTVGTIEDKLVKCLE